MEKCDGSFPCTQANNSRYKQSLMVFREGMLIIHARFPVRPQLCDINYSQQCSLDRSLIQPTLREQTQWAQYQKKRPRAFVWGKGNLCRDIWSCPICPSTALGINTLHLCIPFPWGLFFRWIKGYVWQAGKPRLHRPWHIQRSHKAQFKGTLGISLH